MLGLFISSQNAGLHKRSVNERDVFFFFLASSSVVVGHFDQKGAWATTVVIAFSVIWSLMSTFCTLLLLFYF